MNVISPNTHEVIFKVRGKGLSLLERKMFKCMAVIYVHGGHGDRYKFAKIHHNKFKVNNNGGVTRAQAIFQGIAGEYKGFIEVQPGYLQGEYSKGYRVTKLGIKELRKVLEISLKEAPLSEKEVNKTNNADGPLEAIHRENLLGLNLSDQFPIEGLLPDALETLEFYRRYRQSKGGFGRFSKDKNNRIYHPITNLRRTQRPLVTLEAEGGAPLAEVDIKCSGAQMMLKAGMVHPSEKEKWTRCIHQDQFYEYIWRDHIPRSNAKKSVNAAFNGSRGKGWRRMLMLFPETTGALERQTGLDLMKTESLVMNSLFERFTIEGISLLRLHDAFLCRIDDQAYIASVMKDMGIATDLAQPAMNKLMEIYKE